jgi:SAM-dependent methyltransferase
LVRECRICHSHGEFPTFQVREMQLGMRDTFTYFECTHCRCLQIENVPADLERYYPKHYYSLNDWPPNHFKPLVRKWVKKLRTLYAVQDVGWLGQLLYQKSPEIGLRALSYIRPKLTDRILDVGCGRGGNLYHLKTAGYKNLLGIDPFLAEDIEYRNGLKILKQTLEGVQGEWDVIMLHHSYEHMINPAEALQLISKRLSKQGWCLLRLPISTSWAWRHYRENWVQLDAPRHIFLHSLESLQYLANAAGLAIKHISYDSEDFQFLFSELYSRNISMSEWTQDRNRYRDVISDQMIKEFKRQAQELNRSREGDQICCYLQVASD